MLEQYITDPGVSVELKSPKEMHFDQDTGISVWMYRVTRNEHILNQPAERIGVNQVRRQPLPVNLHYLVTPMMSDPLDEQELLGRVLEALNDHPVLSGANLAGALLGSQSEFRIALETPTLEELTRVWDGAAKVLPGIGQLPGAGDPDRFRGAAPGQPGGNAAPGDPQPDRFFRWMMFANRYQVQVGSRLYTVIDDLTSIYQVLVAGRLTSTPSGAALLPAVQVDHPGVQVKIGQDGFFCLATHVPLVFPDLDTTPYNLNLTLQAEHHPPLAVPLPVPAGSSFPLPLLDLSLRYDPPRIQGGVTMGIGGAAVGLARVVLDQRQTCLPCAPRCISTTRRAHRWALARLPTWARRGCWTSRRPSWRRSGLRLDNSAALLPGSVLRLGGEPDYEFMVVDFTRLAAGAGIFTGGLRRSYPAGAPAQAVTAAPGAAVALDRDASAGQGLLWLVAGLSAGGIQVQDANPNQVEFHALGVLSRDTAQDRGYYHSTAWFTCTRSACTPRTPPPPILLTRARILTPPSRSTRLT